MIERIDHVVAVVEDFATARQVWADTGCPIIWDGRMERHASCCFSIGAVNLELLSVEAFAGWPALARWSEWTTRRFGLHAVAFDPGDLAATAQGLRAAGLDVSEPREGWLRHPADANARWRNSYVDGLAGLLPGLPSFLCEFLAPRSHLGAAAPPSPVRLVEVRVGVPVPETVAEAYARVLNVRPDRDEDGYRLPLADTPIRLMKGDGLYLLLESLGADLPLRALSRAVPGIRWVTLQERHLAR
jgi:hypothetical protein